MDENLTTDLFGDVVTLPSGRRGRPAHRWTKSNGDRVILGLAMGFRDEEIAFGLRISVPTLRKHYFSELKVRKMQRTRFEMWRAHRLADLANEGNVGAMKELSKLVEKRDRLLAEERLREAGEGEDKEQPIGKKEAARRSAAALLRDGGDGWGSDLNPGKVN